MGHIVVFAWRVWVLVRAQGLKNMVRAQWILQESSRRSVMRMVSSMLKVTDAVVALAVGPSSLENGRAARLAGARGSVLPCILRPSP